MWVDRQKVGAMNEVKPPSVTVIGGGIVGTVCANYLRRDGFAVTLIDRNGGEPKEMASFGNTGGISPASVVPIAMPGMFKDVPKWIVDPLGPLHLRLSHLPACLPWLYRFFRESSLERVEAISKALASLNKSTFEAYEPLLDEAGLKSLFRRTGQLFVYRSERSFREDRLALNLRAATGLPTEELGSDEIRQLEPALSPEFRKAQFIPYNGHCVDPYGLVEGLTRHFVRRGGTVLREDVVAFDVGPEGPRAIRTASGKSIAVDAVLIAAGAWSNTLIRQLGHRVPLETHRGYHVTLPNPSAAPRIMILSVEDKIAATPMAMGLRIAGTVELAGLKAAPNFERARRLLALGKRVFPGLNTSGYTQWMGHRPCLPDSLPILGRSPNHRNVFFAFGHGHQGLLGASRTGQVLAEIINGREPSFDLAPFKVDRF
jgi:glycine/D-amino acid oxidase-like deaminating enzyme